MNTTWTPRRRVLLIALLAMGAVGIAQPTAVHASAGTRITAQLIGQVSNPTPAVALQYGYLSALQHLDPADLAAGGELSERTARFTFFSDTATQRVTMNGPLRVIDRTGTLGIYLDSAPNGDWSRPQTFQDGEQILGAQSRHQVVIDTLTGAFTANFDLDVTWSARFSAGNGTYQLGTAGDQGTITFYGHLNQPPLAAHIAGVLRGLEVRR